ncbi:probable 2-oxoglutarate-dependent dioxygenase AOP1 [Ricinus communis]|uniref:Gibberellin 20 oxidase, putative n=1 Tax=Ricinus communis TaxID=3988 RepID=B9RUX9_RICCO|nr:probable 2-oxoglutarate-dependent dioxygenase AOP1 [Ricinus communis]EEF44712.1 Gibberellin 20 oxidase, putative [Ricinus communis]|eukprot:XP_002517548.1 probable 2-oxoglutarate-dependent dioxygenase AOP1 [Ricinus communis]
MGSAAQPKLPVLDFTLENLKPGTSCWAKACGEVRQALEEYGCFIVEYNNILSPKLRDGVFNSLKELFDLPTETKMQNKYQKPLNGYVGQIAKLPLHESMGIDNATCLEATQDFTTLMWPDGNDNFCECVYEYAKLTAEIDQMVTRMIFESYGAEKYHDSYVESTNYLLRLLKNRLPKGDEPNLGFITHTDKSFTTILHQNHINGLEVDTKDGQKINIEFSPSSFVVIAGDALMVWSNDRIISPSHRVIINGKEDRYSMGLFAFNSGIIRVPEELIDKDHPLMYKPLDHIGLLYFYRTDEGYKSKCPVKAFCGV